MISLKISAQSLNNGLQNSTADLHTLPRQTSCYLPPTGSIATVSDVWEVDQDVVVGTMDTMDTCLQRASTHLGGERRDRIGRGGGEKGLKICEVASRRLMRECE